MKAIYPVLERDLNDVVESLSVIAETTPTGDDDDSDDDDDDVTPIIVGCSLAAIIIAVLVWYIFARSVQSNFSRRF